MRSGFRFPDETDLWQRLSWDLTHHSRHAHFMEAVARLCPGVEGEQARAELSRLAARLGQELPDSNKDWGARLVPLHTDVVGDYGPARPGRGADAAAHLLHRQRLKDHRGEHRCDQC